MKALFVLIAVAAPILAQEPPPPVQLPQPQLNFRNFQLPARPNPFHIVNPVTVNPAPKFNFVAAGPKVCAIPLLQMVPKGNYSMIVAKPSNPEPNAPKFNVPAPACERP
jgi:hypothetical protein